MVLVVVVSGFSRTFSVGAAFRRPISQGRTVWDGVYTDAQAERGRAAYSQSCMSCHRDDLKGDGTAPSLVGESFAFLWGDMMVGDLFTRVRAIMPPERPSSLSAQSYVDIIAFILQKNAFPAGERELDANSETLAQILITTTRPGNR
jgi:quinoprotein glucose dehydrogenase